MYATVADIRAEGVTERVATDERIENTLIDAVAFIDRVTEMFFERRSLSIDVSGRQKASSKVILVLRSDTMIDLLTTSDFVEPFGVDILIHF